MKSGIINVYKEAGFTSFDVVAKLRGILGIRKIGHTGTLDPDAVGVLPVCIGKATKVCDLLTDKNKTYEAVMRLGLVTDTQDMSGTVLSTSDVLVSEDEVRDAVISFVGDSMQIPPMYSALKVNGKKLYELARAGQVVERKPRPITIFQIEIQSIELPKVTFSVTCSKGTYIRTLCHDIGEKLGCGACMEHLTRTQVSIFSIEDSFTLEQIEQMKAEGSIEQHILSVDGLFSSMKKIVAKEETTMKLQNGNKISLAEVKDASVRFEQHERVRLYMADGRFVGIFTQVDGLLKPEKMFLE